MRFSSSASSSSSRSGGSLRASALQRSSSSNSRSSSGFLIFLRSLSSALHALLDHHQVAQDQLDLHVFEIAHRIDRALLVRHRVVLEQAQHVRQGVHHAQAGQVAGIAQRSPSRSTGKSRYSTVACVILGGSNSFGQRVQARVGHLGHADARLQSSRCASSSCTPVRIVNREVLPTMGRPIMAVFIMVAKSVYSGTSTWREDLFAGCARPRRRGAATSVGARVDHHAMREHRNHQPLDVVRNGVVAAFHQRQRLRRRDTAPASRAGSRPAPAIRACASAPRSPACNPPAPRPPSRACTASCSCSNVFADEHRPDRVGQRRLRRCARSRARWPRPDSRCACASGSGRAAIRAADRCRDAPPGSAWRSP